MNHIVHTNQLHSTLSFPFPSETLAGFALQTLEPDAEIRPELVKRTLWTKGKELFVRLDCSSAKVARVSVNSLMDNMELIVRTMDELADL